MARRGRRKHLVPGADRALEVFKGQVMRQEGYAVDPNRPSDVKYEVAKDLGVPLNPRYNGRLETEDAGKIGGKIGGSMVREMIRMAQERLSKPPQP